MPLDFDMGKYAVFVWSAWGLTAAVLGGLVFDTLSRARRWNARLKAREEERGA